MQKCSVDEEVMLTAEVAGSCIKISPKTSQLTAALFQKAAKLVLMDMERCVHKIFGILCLLSFVQGCEVARDTASVGMCQGAASGQHGPVRLQPLRQL